MRFPKRARMRYLAAIAAFAILSTGAVFASTDPDTPTALKGNILIGKMSKDGTYTPHYFSFVAGPGDVKLRATLRPNSDGEVLKVTVQDQDGNQVAQVQDGTSNDKDSVLTKSFSLDAKKTLVLKIEGSASFYGKRHPTYRIQLDGAVTLDKTLKPLNV